MAQKKKASAARTATVSVSLPSSQEETGPVWPISSAPCDSQAGSAAEVPSFENGGGPPRRRDVTVPGKGDVIEKAHGKEVGAPNGSETVLSIVGPGGSTVTSSGKGETVNSTLVRGECEKALVALRRGNSTKALRLIKDACNRNETSGIAHRVQGHIFMRLASVIEDTNTKQRHSASALESARRAASFSPQSVEYAHFYAQLLYEAAKDSKGYEEVVRECERALLIDDPVDPARESLHNEQPQELATVEARIDNVHQELKSLLQKAKNISHFPTPISTWMKTLGNGAGEEKLRFVQMRKFADQDPMEQKVSQPKRPHEVKKVVKTPEERRKEIEVRVAAARLLQQRDSSANGGADSPEDMEKSLQKKLERRKSSGPNSRRLAKPLSTDERTDRVRQLWHGLSQEKRETLLQVSIAELKDHLASWKEVGGLVKSHAASDALLEALEFAQEKKTWRFWACCQCGERFASDQDFNHHTSEHVGSLPQHLHHYLMELAQACGVGSQSEGISGETGEEDIIQDRLFLNEDFTQLLLDERVVKEFPEIVTDEIVAEEGPAAHRPPLPLMKGKGGETAITHMDLQLSWIFGTAEYEFQPSGWKQFREEQGQRGRDMYRSLENEFQRLHALCTKKYELESCEEAINLVERLCVVEKNRRAQQFDTGKSLKTVLEERQQELLLIPRLNVCNGGLSLTQEAELDAITNVLRDAQTGTVRRLLNNGGLGVRVSDSDEDDEEAWRMQKPTYHTDSRVEAVIARQREQLSLEANCLDPKIMMATDDFQRLEIKLRQLAVLDYRAVALPLVKSLLQSRLEGEAEKDAAQKSDAAQEAFLAELAKDQKSLGSKEVENPKQARGKSKEKRKTKDQKKLKDVKRVPTNSEKPGESASVELDEVDGADNWDWVVGDDLKQQCTSVKLHQAELWEEERKLLEALELQRRVEEETKQKHLDEQERKKQLWEEERKLLEALELQRRVEEETKQKHLDEQERKKQLWEEERKLLEAIELQRRVEEETKQKHLDEQERKKQLWEEERKLLEAIELQRRVEEETKQKHLDEQQRKKQMLQQIIQPLEDATGSLSTASSTVDVVSPRILPTISLKLLSVQNGCQGREVAESLSAQTIQPSEYSTNTLRSHSLPAQNEHSMPDQISVNFPPAESTRGISEQQLVKDSCNKVLEKVGLVEGMPPAGTDVLLAEDGDHLNSVQKKTRGGGSRNRRRRGPRIYAEEGIIADQDAESCKTSDFANGPRTLIQQNASKNNGRSSTIDQPKPLLRQNASRRFGVAPANGVHAVQPLLLLPAPPSFEGSGGHEGKKTLRQLQAEQDDEERFQADLEQAMRQSLDMLTSQSTGPIASSSVSSSSPITVSSNGIPGDYRTQQLLGTGAVGSFTRTVGTPLKEVEEVGIGLRNEIGEYNCFLNVVIQSLWHLRRFREELLADSSMQHVHVGNPCVVCALRNIFLGLNAPVHNTSSRDAVAPTALRVALSALYSDSDFFQEAQMNDASEVLAVIFDCLHKAFVPNSSSDGDSESSTGGSWDCQGQHPCMAHALFGLDVAEQMNCQSCGLESRHLKYTAFFHNINASALRTIKLLYPDSSMDELLKLVDMNHQLACDTETGGCGRSNHIHHLLHAAPPVFTTVLGWQNGCESFEDISATVDAMDAALDVGVIYRGLDEGFQHRLVSVVCYYGRHYHCFAYNREHCRWVMFDDSTVKVVGEWRDVTSICRRGHLQPQVLFYEAVSSEAVTVTVC